MLRPGQSQPRRAEGPSQGWPNSWSLWRCRENSRASPNVGSVLGSANIAPNLLNPGSPWGVSLEPTFRASLGAGGPSSEDLARGILSTPVSVWEPHRTQGSHSASLGGGMFQQPPPARPLGLHHEHGGVMKEALLLSENSSEIHVPHERKHITLSVFSSFPPNQLGAEPWSHRRDQDLMSLTE